MRGGDRKGIRIFSVLDGLYKVEYGVNDAFGRSVMCMRLIAGLAVSEFARAMQEADN